MAALKKYVGDAAIGRAIRGLDTRLGNVNTDVQAIAVSIVEHADGAGNGDMSRFLDLCKVVNKHRTLNVAFLIGWGRAFGRVNTNLRAKDGAGQVSLIKDRKFDVDGARANNWYEAYVNGERAPWYAGPAPAAFEPATIGDIAEDFRRFVKREMDKLTATKEIGGKVVPIVNITDADKAQLDNAFDFINKLANTLARHEDVARKLAEAEAAKAALEAEADPQVESVLQPQEKMVA